MTKQVYTGSEARVSHVESLNMNQSGVKFTAYVIEDNGGDALECTMFGGQYTKLHDAFKSDDDKRKADATAEIVSIILAGNGREYLHTTIE